MNLYAPSTLEQFIFIMSIIVIFFVVGFFTYMMLKFAYGQDFDPQYACLMADQYPFSEMCDEQRINELMDQLLERAREWNNLTKWEK